MADEPKTLTSLAELGEVARPDADIEPEPQIDRLGRTYATGKRKDAVARVWLRPGIGTITVNKRPVENYFARPALRMIINQPAELVGRRTQYDVICTVKGGGLSGQAGALRHGISRALAARESRSCARCSSPAASSPGTAASWSARSTASARPAAASSSPSGSPGVAGAAALMCVPAPAPAITADLP